VLQLEIKHLKLIRSIADTGNMTRAAEHLFLSQSALSQQLKEMENRLGTMLFTRTKKKMILTATGKKLLETAIDVIDTLEDLEIEIAKSVSGDSGELKVGTQCLFCYKWLPKVFRQFQKNYPNILFDMGTSHSLKRDLEKQSFDLVITGAPANDKFFQSYPLFYDQMVCIMEVNHPLSERNYVEFESLLGECLIAHKEKAKNQIYQQGFQFAKLEPRQYMVIEQPQAIIEMVAAGFGISIVPQWSVNKPLESGKLIARPVTRKGIGYTWQATMLKNAPLTVFQKTFISLVTRMPLLNHNNIIRAANSL